MAYTSPEQLVPLPQGPLPAESAFYLNYEWCLNPYPTFQEIRQHLKEEAANLEKYSEDWQVQEIANNIFLLAGSLLGAVDDYFLGPWISFSKAVKHRPALARLASRAESVLSLRQRLRERRAKKLIRFREQWSQALVSFLGRTHLLATANAQDVSSGLVPLLELADWEFPHSLLRSRPRLPAAFRSQSLTPADAVALAKKFVAEFPDRDRMILILGVRTAGAYLGLLVEAYLKSCGYECLDAATIRPKRTLSSFEARKIVQCAARGGLVLLVDEPVSTGRTIARATRLLEERGIAPRHIVLLLPIQPTRRKGDESDQFAPVSGLRHLNLPREVWHKQLLLAPAAVESRVQEYMRARGYRGARLTTSPGLSAVHKAFQQVSVERGHIHFKQLYEFTVEKDSGETAVRYVLAKSVGWGWYGYHAFVIASRIGRHLPPVLGLRDGILYTEWLPGANHGARPSADPEAIITTLAGYVADRTRALRLAGDLAIDLDRDNQLKGVDLLADTLRRAYRHPIAAALRRPRLRQAIARRGGYPPTLIDGRMRPLEWITSNGRILKTDFEHHGLGKTELNVTDPAYDLAESVLHWGLSPGEEERLLAHYVSASGDSQVRDRMFLQKLTAALWACETALNDMKKPERFGRHAEMNELYLRARRFLTREIAHYCGRHCVPPKRRQWRGPLVVLDVDGVIDDWFFSFPTTTAAGMRAISMLNAHEMPIVLNSARTLEEISEYSEAYGLLGGAGEYGSALYDALTGRQRVLVSRESLEEVARIREALRQTPGVFVNDHYRYSVRAYTFERYEPTHLSRSIVTDLFRKLGTNRLRLVQTNTDSAIIAEEADKGTGLKALLSWVGLEDDETIAVGDSEPDLAMFRVAARSFAPRQIKCREAAATLGCRIARRPQQRGLLEIVRLLVHENRQYCSQCAACQHLWPEGQNLFLDLLESADDRGPGPLMTSLADPLAWRAFVE